MDNRTASAPAVFGYLGDLAGPLPASFAGPPLPFYASTPRSAGRRMHYVFDLSVCACVFYRVGQKAGPQTRDHNSVKS